MGGVAWSEEEDQLLRKCIEQYGEGKWHRIPLLAGINRCRKSCRLRWLNYLRPNIKRGKFTDEEVELIIKLHNLLGNRWSLIAGRLPGRTANDVKNFWHCHLSKRLNSHLIVSQSNAATKNHTKNQLVTESSSFKVVEQEKQLITQNSSFRLPEHEISQIHSRHDHVANLSSIIEIVPSAHDTAYQYSNSNNNNHNNNAGLLENDKFSGEENIILQERSNIDDIDFELDEIKITVAGDHENYYWSFDDLLYDIEQQNKAFEAKYECLLSSYRT